MIPFVINDLSPNLGACEMNVKSPKVLQIIVSVLKLVISIPLQIVTFFLYCENDCILFS